MRSLTGGTSNGGDAMLRAFVELGTSRNFSMAESVTQWMMQASVRCAGLCFSLAILAVTSGCTTELQKPREGTARLQWLSVYNVEVDGTVPPSDCHLQRLAGTMGAQICSSEISPGPHLIEIKLWQMVRIDEPTGQGLYFHGIARQNVSVLRTSVRAELGHEYLYDGHSLADTTMRR